MKMNKKGFTIVELVIVIAVIAILAAVLIPTFSSVVANAQSVAALQQASSGRDAIMTLTNGTLPDGTLFVVDRDSDNAGDYWFAFTKQTMEAVEVGTLGSVKAYSVANVTVEEETVTKKTYAVYVSADAVDGTNVKETTLVMINNALEESGVAARLAVSDNVTKTSTQAGTQDGDAIEFTAVNTNPEDSNITSVKIYYSGDLKTTLVVFVGDKA